MRALFRLIGRFGHDQRGNLAVIFGIAVLPLITAVGCAVDYSQAMRMKAKLQSAADAAAVGAVAKGSPAYVQAGQMGGNGTLGNGVTDATNIFNANISGLTGYGNLRVTPNVAKTNATITSQISFSATVPTMFLSVIGYSNLTISGSSQAAGQLPMYLDYYLALDVSGSMGLPSTPAEAVRLQNISPDNYVQYPTGCTLACHFSQPPLSQLSKSACIDPSPNTPTGASPTQKYPTGNYCLGYDISRVSQSAYAQLLSNHGGQLPAYKYTSKSSPPTQVAQPTAFYSTSTQYPNDPVLTAVSSCSTAGTDACIQLRLDAVGYALTQLFITANQYELVTDQFRIGLYPFIQNLYSYFPLTYSFNGSPNTPGTINYAAAQLATLLDNNNNSNLGSGGTHIDNALNSVNNLIVSVGNGTSSTNTLPNVFLITDGAQDNQTKGVPNGSWSGSNHATVLSNSSNTYPSACQTLKNRGIVISVLYIPYQPINPVNASFAGDEDDYANNNIPNIPPSLTACASPNKFYTASTPQAINDALVAMFKDSLLSAHITN